jgi:RNA polymerase sigma factor (sigma-70 family)
MTHDATSVPWFSHGPVNAAPGTAGLRALPHRIWRGRAPQPECHAEARTPCSLLSKDAASTRCCYPVHLMTAPDSSAPLSQQVVDVLLANHRAFLRYVERRIGDRALAEEIVQDAFVRSLDRGEEIRESVVGWFYRVLRNAVIDQQRRQSTAHRRLDAFAAELASESAEGELSAVACKCVTELARTLKAEYAEALQRIEVEGVTVADYAQAAGISASNAGVRVFRAREALRKQVARACGTCAEHGCLDCHCQPAGPSAGAAHGGCA